LDRGSAEERKRQIKPFNSLSLFPRFRVSAITRHYSMNQSNSSRFNLGGFAIGLGVGVALSVALGPTLGIPMGAGLAVVFGLNRTHKC
jgi:hypothetical protein